MAYNPNAGWRGVVEIDGVGSLRFTDESIVVNQGLAISDDVHVGQRTAGVYEYRHIIPEGSLSFPVLTETRYMVASSPPPTIETVCAHMMRQGIKPYTVTDPLEPPIITATTMDIRRGDSKKTINAPYIGEISLDGQSGGRVNVTCNVRAIYGSYASDTAPTGFSEIVRAVFFNELYWTTLPGVEDFSGETNIYPRSFRFSSNTNLINDDSYNPAEPQSLRGFVFGRQDVTANIVMVGAIDPVRGGLHDTDPVVQDISIGGLYDITDGLWTEKVINVPGPADIAITELTLRGMGTSAFCVTPGIAIGA